MGRSIKVAFVSQQRSIVSVVKLTEQWPQVVHLMISLSECSKSPQIFSSVLECRFEWSFALGLVDGGGGLNEATCLHVPHKAFISVNTL